MKATDLKEVIKKAKTVIDRKNIVPVYDNVLIDNGFMTVQDLSVGVEYSQRVDIDENITCLVDFRTLEQIAKKLPKSVDLSFKPFEEKIQLSFDNNKFELPTYDPKDFERLAENEDFEEPKLFNKEIIQELKTCLKYVADDELRPTMNGVYIDPEGQCVASDSHKIRFKKVNHGIKTKDVILSVKFIKVLGLQEYAIFENSKYIMAANESEVITSRIIEGHYPNWRAVIPSQNNSIITCDRKELIDKLQLALIASNKATSKVALDIQENNITILSNDLDYDIEYKGDIKSTLIGESLKIGVKQPFLDMILKTESKKIVTFEMSDPSRAIIIDGINLLMPMEV